MYLVSQMWWLLFLAFLVGLLVGYVLWKACGHRRIASSFERSRQEMASRIAALEQERRKFADTAVEAEGSRNRLQNMVARLETELAQARGAASEVAEIKRARDDVTAELKRLKDGLKSRDKA